MFVAIATSGERFNNKLTLLYTGNSSTGTFTNREDSYVMLHKGLQCFWGEKNSSDIKYNII